MKTTLLFVFGFYLILNNFYYSQTRIEVNFNNATYDQSATRGLKRGDWYYFEIENINRNNYNVEIIVKDSIVSVPIDFSDFSDFGASGLVDMIGSVSLITKQLFTPFINKESSMESSNGFVGEKSHQSNKPDPEIAKEKENVKTQLNELIDIQKELNAINFNFDHEIDAIQNKLDRVRLNDTLNKVSNADLTRFENLIRETKTQIFNIKSKLSSKQTALGIYTIERNDQIKKAKLDTVYKALIADYTNLTTVCSEAFNNLSGKKIDSMSLQLIECINLSGGRYISFPYRYNGEIAAVELKFTPYSTQSKLPTIILPIEINTMRYYVGIGPGLYTSGLYDKVYSIQTLHDAIQDTTTYKIVEEKSSRMEVGLSVLLRGGAKCKKNELFGYHGSLGVGFSFTNPSKPRMMYGIGGTYGDRHRVAVDIGLATGYTNVLSRAYSLDSQYSEAPDSVIVSKMNTNIFFSVGYTFVF